MSKTDKNIMSIKAVLDFKKLLRLGQMFYFVIYVFNVLSKHSVKNRRFQRFRLLFSGRRRAPTESDRHTKVTHWEYVGRERVVSKCLTNRVRWSIECVKQIIITRRDFARAGPGTRDDDFASDPRYPRSAAYG